MKTSFSPGNRHFVRSWYGLFAEISVDQNFWHLVRVGGMSIYHPPLVNLILRRGLPPEERSHLSFLHEFGHIQTVPVAILHAFALAVVGYLKRNDIASFFIYFLAAAIANGAVWELASEVYVIGNMRSKYRSIYQETPNRLGRVVFWGGMFALAVGFTVGLLHR